MAASNPLEIDDSPIGFDQPDLSRDFEAEGTLVYMRSLREKLNLLRFGTMAWPDELAQMSDLQIITALLYRLAEMEQSTLASIYKDIRPWLDTARYTDDLQFRSAFDALYEAVIEAMVASGTMLVEETTEPEG